MDDELERQLRHASFFVQASLEQQGQLARKLDVYVTSVIELLLDKGVIDAEALATAVDGNREREAADTRARYEGNGNMPSWPTVVVREDAPHDEPPPDVEVDCAARMHICKAACCSLPFPLSADEVEAGAIKWDLGHPYVIRQDGDGYCVHNERPSGGCEVYDHRPSVCRGYSCADDDRIWSDFDNMVLNEDFLSSRRRSQFHFKPQTADAVPVTITSRSRRPVGVGGAVAGGAGHAGGDS